MTRMRKLVSIATCLVLGLGMLMTGCGGQNAERSGQRSPPVQGEILLEEVFIPGPKEGTQIYLRHKYNSGKTSYKGNEIVLFLEPYSVPTAEAFDVPGISWMEDFAQRGYDTWAMDFRGFGKSTRPEEMNVPPEQHPPVIRSTDAVEDVKQAVEYIRKIHKVEKISIVGWSWGAVVAGQFAVNHSVRIQKLVLYGAMHGFPLPEMANLYEAPGKPGQFNEQMPAYQVVNFDNAMHHWRMMLNGRDLVSAEAMEAVREVFIASDPESAKHPEQAIRRPTGPLADLYQIWSNKPLFDAARIPASVLIIRGEDDFFADPGLFEKLTGTGNKKEIVVEEATHWLLYEKNRDKLLEETDRYLQSL